MVGLVMPFWSALSGLSNLLDGMGGGFAPPLAHDPARDAAIRAMVPLVPDTGWTRLTLRAAAGENADLLFPGGPAEMVEAHSDLGDRMMEETGRSIAETRVSRRVRALILLRLRQAEPDRDAVRHGLSLLAMPGSRGAGLRSLARTVDTIWHAAGDQSADMSWYSKRALLAGVYSSTLLYWLKRGSCAETEAFLDRQLAAVAKLGRVASRSRKLPGSAVTSTDPGVAGTGAGHT
ncbi:COQ9 family protein [Lichenicola cladoniae]|uniref:COQ9 family protein n=1 Tax=Lichenicola cladoniae TaxID=1484109 RepID=A0A6M8HQR4_9PROT|nr:COQ9 family protein [Lichenicola cladoniae]NPD67982.1 COQ9 family protein [Acetobacteraceae bacterium]QKE90571.1 COQ9 family protein [Lichenicola cladoniae]